MDLVDLIEGRRFLGNEFLVWLWFESEKNDGNFDVDPIGPFALWFENTITLESTAVQVEQSKLKGAAPSSTQEAREALRHGKLPTQARIRIEQGPHQYACMITAASLGLSSVTIPALLKDDAQEKFYERMYLIEQLEKYLGSLYTEFLELRLSPSWEQELMPQISKWVWDDGTGEAREAADRRQKILDAARRENDEADARGND